MSGSKLQKIDKQQGKTWAKLHHSFCNYLVKNTFFGIRLNVSRRFENEQAINRIRLSWRNKMKTKKNRKY